MTNEVKSKHGVIKDERGDFHIFYNDQKIGETIFSEKAYEIFSEHKIKEEDRQFERDYKKKKLFRAFKTPLIVLFLHISFFIGMFTAAKITTMNEHWSEGVTYWFIFFSILGGVSGTIFSIIFWIDGE